MNVVIFGKGFGRLGRINLSGRAAAALGAVFAGVIGALTFGAGYWYSAQTGSGVSFSEAENLARELHDQRTRPVSRLRTRWTRWRSVSDK